MSTATERNRDTAAQPPSDRTRDELCGDWPAPCNCDDPETHDGATEEPGTDVQDRVAQALCAIEERSKVATLEEVQAGIQRWTRHRYEAERLIEMLADYGLCVTPKTTDQPDGGTAAQLEKFVDRWEANDMNGPKIYGLVFREKGRVGEVSLTTGMLRQASEAIRALEALAGLLQSVESLREYAEERGQWLAHDQARLDEAKKALAIANYAKR